MFINKIEGDVFTSEFFFSFVGVITATTLGRNHIHLNLKKIGE